jgi:hypothetical protein
MPSEQATKLKTKYQFEPQNWINSISTLNFRSENSDHVEWILWVPPLCRTEKQITCRNTIAHPDGLNETREDDAREYRHSYLWYWWLANFQTHWWACRAEMMHLLRPHFNSFDYAILSLLESLPQNTKSVEGRCTALTWGIFGIAISLHLVGSCDLRGDEDEYRAEICNHHGRDHQRSDRDGTRDQECRASRGGRAASAPTWPL